MASPMNWFRKYQKVMLVVFGVALMVVFLLPQLGDFSGNRANKIEDPVLVSWNGGSLRRSQLARMRTLHFQTVEFLKQLQLYAAQKKGRPIVPLVDPIVAISGTEEYNEERADELMLNRYLFAEEARKLGAVVSDEMVNDYVAYSGGEIELSDDELRDIVRNASGGIFSLSQIKEHLKLELASRQFQQMTQTGVQFIPNPVSAAQMYRRATAEMECTVFPVAIADYLPKVDSQPSDADLMTVFGQGRYLLPDPTMQEPGFKVPRKINVQYVVAEFETFLQNEINKLTDAEVEAEYDRLVAAKDPSVMDLVDQADPGAPADAAATDAAPESPATGGESNPEQPASGAPEAGESPPSSGDEKPAGEPGDEASAASPDAGETPPTDGEGANPDGAGTPEQAGGDGAAKMTSREPGHHGQAGLVAGWMSRFATGLIAAPLFRQDETPANQDPRPEGGDTPPAEAEDKPAETPAADNAGSEQQPAAGTDQPPEMADPAVQEPAAPQPAGEDASEPAVDPATPAADPSAAQPAVTDPGALTGPASLPQTPEVEKRPKPLKDVADQIKRQMKSEAAREAMRNKVLALEEAVREYQQDLLIWDSAPEEEREAKPALPDFARLAADSGLQYNESGLVDEEAMNKLSIGKLFVFFQQRQILALAQVLFGTFEQLREFDPRQELSFQDSNIWLYWVQETRKIETREFKDAREDVVAFWKMRQARNMARAEAENIVQEVNSSGQQLNQRFGDKAVNTGAFSWYSGGQNDFGLGAPIGVEGPSDEFMQIASGLENGKAGFAANLPRDRFYVIQRIAGDRRSPEELTENFIQQVATSQSLPIGVQGANQNSVREISFDFMDRFLKEHKIEWTGR